MDSFAVFMEDKRNDSKWYIGELRSLAKLNVWLKRRSDFQPDDLDMIIIKYNPAQILLIPKDIAKLTRKPEIKVKKEDNKN